MNILVDFSPIPIQKVGVGIYAFNLLHKIRQIDGQNKYFVLAQDDDTSVDSLVGRNFKILKINSKIFRNDFFMVVMEQFYIPYLVIKYRINLVHSLHFSFPLLAPVKRVVTIHDLTTFQIPVCHRLIHICFFRLFIFFTSLFATKIITDSDSTLNDLVRRFKFAERKVQTIYLGKSDTFRPDLDVLEIERIKHKYNINTAYLLFLGTIEPRKNIPNLIIAFNKFVKEQGNYQLVIAGKKGWYYSRIFELVDKMSLQDKVQFVGFIEEEDKPFLIVGAKVFIYPSLYEGFGIPVLEAISCGVPTVTSNISSMPEIVADAALLIDPLDTEAIYTAIKKLTGDDNLRRELRQKSIVQAAKFSWDNTAGQTVEVYNSLQ